MTKPFDPIALRVGTAFKRGLATYVEAGAAGAGAELRQPLGVAVVGGLLVSQVLTLYMTPVLYIYMERLAQAARAWRARIFASSRRRASNLTE